jgi:hypothetical protein
MSFQWLQTRITEEQDRRDRESRVLARLPDALEEMHRNLGACIAAYTSAFGPDAAEIRFEPPVIRITAREEREGRWQPCGKVEVTAVPTLPGFRIERGGDPLLIEIGLLPGEKLFYKDQNAYLTMEELTRRILDSSLFPKLGE